jgi:hypothetical protein
MSCSSDCFGAATIAARARNRQLSSPNLASYFICGHLRLSSSILRVFFPKMSNRLAGHLRRWPNSAAMGQSSRPWSYSSTALPTPGWQPATQVAMAVRARRRREGWYGAEYAQDATTHMEIARLTRFDPFNVARCRYPTRTAGAGTRRGQRGPLHSSGGSHRLCRKAHSHSPQTPQVRF